jgi:FkbM family methyltransferase
MPAYSNLPFGVRAARFINQLPIRGRSRFVSWLLRRFSYFHEQRVTLGNRTVYADFRQAMCFGLAVRSLEDEEQTIIRKYVRPDDVAFDIGGNVGLHTGLLADLAREVHVFEPQPRPAALLHKSFVSAGNVTVHELALSNFDGDVDLFVPSDDSMASLGKCKGGRSIRCTAARLDSLHLPHPAFIKCDVEGAELVVFRGAEKILDRKDAPVLLFEQSSEAMTALCCQPDDVTTFLTGLRADYQITELGQRSEDTFCVNVLAVPASRAQELEV